jgi:ribonuclease-3
MMSELQQRPSTRYLEAFEEALGHCFSDKELLTRSLTHRSFANEQAEPVADNERLEFLGDSVLQLAVSERLMNEFPSAPEGFLSRVRSHLVNTDRLAQFARQISLGNVLLLGRSEHADGGREKDSILGSALEAVLGAVFIDSNYETAREIVFACLGGAFEDFSTEEIIHPKTRLQEWFQRTGRTTPDYTLVGRSGPDHRPVYEMSVAVAGEELARGEGSSKREAETAAAEAALTALRERDGSVL